MTHLRILVLIAVLASGIALFSCSSGGNKSSTQPTATSKPPSSSGGDAKSALQDLIGKLATKEVKAAYTYTYTYGSGTKAEPSTATAQGMFTFYSKPPDWRWDVTWDATGGGRSASIISAGGNSYLCTPDNGGTCSKQPANASGLYLEGQLLQSLDPSSSKGLRLPFLALFVNPQSTSTSITDLPAIDRSNKTVAGQEAGCFSLSSATYDVQALEFCFSSNGVLLSEAYETSSELFNMQATSIEGSVAASDLEPPYPVQTIPGQ